MPRQPKSEGPTGDPTCSGTIDNDCDGVTDIADSNCAVQKDGDIDGDGRITVFDARKLVLLCTRPRCATE